MPIRQLTPAEINRIAAGEVIERPASAVKELAENAIDAGATEIEVVATDGGLSLIRVTDNGAGMDVRDLALCVERHATSKLAGGDLSDIRSLGFRGEALPSIGAAGRLSIVSRAAGSAHAHEISVAASVVSEVRPAAHPRGTRIEVRDLFFATPARLKFMKSERAENTAISDVVKRLALAFPQIGFSCTCGERTGLSLTEVQPGDEEGLRRRLARIMGRDFAEGAEPIAFERGGISVSGFAGRPTLNRPDAALQYLFVNGRPVKDRLLLSAVRAAYGDLVPKGRHPLTALFLLVEPERVDVNVHPAKAEVRFRDGPLIRSIVIASLRDALERVAAKTSHHLSRAAIPAFRAPLMPRYGISERASPSRYAPQGFAEREEPPLEAGKTFDGHQSALVPDQPLGQAKAQVHRAYIVTETDNGIVLVDQHAAHERLVYEQLKAALAKGGIARQGLLIPEIVEMDEPDAAILVDHQKELERSGLTVESFGPGAVAVRETPALFGQGNIKALIADLAAQFRAERTEGLEERLHAICATIACHGSVRAGRPMRQEEMDALLRQMEATPNSGQCNHGRPTYVELPLAEIERLFQRR